MTEEFLQHIWKFRLFDQLDLTSVEGEKIEIIKQGEHNFDSGPDFFNAKIKIGKTLWAGNVEVHTNSSDWLKHLHHNDKAYDNIILHAVNTADKKVYRKNGELIPTLELKGRIKKTVYQHYLNLRSSKDWIPCEKQVSSVPKLILTNTLDRLILERLERKSKSITDNLKLNNNNWEETFYQQLARNFGFKTNAETFELLARSTPSFLLAKNKDNLFQLEALLFGQAGMLNEHFQDNYPQALQNEYQFLKQKFKLNSIDDHLWKFLRLRPVNFPTLRIAQFAGLVHSTSHLFSKILETENIKKLKSLFEVSVSDYWTTHYVFDKETNKSRKQLGEDSINVLLINTIVPFLFVYGKQKNEGKYVDKALAILEDIAAEDNSVIKKWKELKVPVKNAYSSQAFLQLKTEHCDLKKCLNCPVGHFLLKNQ